MNRKRVIWFGSFLAAFAIVLAAGAKPAFSQRDAGAKIRGDSGVGFWSNQRAARSMRHARDYSRDLYDYSRDARAIQPEVAKSDSANLGRNIESAKNELTHVRKEQAGDKDVLAALAIIEEHLAKATEHHKTLHAACQKDTVDAAVGMECCNVITVELEKALAEHGALMRKLEIKGQASAAKAAAPDKSK